MRDPYDILIFNPHQKMIDHTRLQCDFTVDAIVADMAERAWTFQPGVYVAIQVDRGKRSVYANYRTVLTFTVEETKTVVGTEV
jgi:hypothetical protein